MSGIYGTVKPAKITANDVEIFYSYARTRNDSDGNMGTFQKLDSSYLQETLCDETGVIPGIYNLRLPLDVFNQKGFYNVYIRPREIKATIQDVGCLATYKDIKGIVFKYTDLNTAGLTTTDLAGYRVEYFNRETGAREDFSRLITSSNRCEGITGAITTNNTDTIRYRFTTTGSLLFCTVTPSIASSFKPNDLPFIGKANQDVVLINTKFNPVLLELEMVDHDIDTVSTMLEGEQVHDVDHGIITTFNSDREAYLQMDYKSLKDSLGNPAYTVKTRRSGYDANQDITSILGNIIDNN